MISLSFMRYNGRPASRPLLSLGGKSINNVIGDFATVAKVTSMPSASPPFECAGSQTADLARRDNSLITESRITLSTPVEISRA